MDRFELLKGPAPGTSVFDMTPLPDESITMNIARNLRVAMSNSLEVLGRDQLPFRREDSYSHMHYLMEIAERNESYLEPISMEKSPSEYQRGLPYALRPGRINLLSFSTKWSFRFDPEYEEYGIENTDQVAFLCGQCFGNAKQRVAVEFILHDCLPREYWYFLLGLLCREAGPSPYNVEVLFLKKHPNTPADWSEVERVFDFLSSCCLDELPAQPRKDCQLTLNLELYDEQIDCLLRMPNDWWTQNLGFILDATCPNFSVDRLPNRIERKTAASKLRVFTEFPSPDPTVQTVLMSILDLESVRTLDLDVVTPGNVEQAWVNFWSDMCPYVEYVVVTSVEKERHLGPSDYQEFGNCKYFDADMSGFTYLQQVNLLRRPSTRTLMSLPPLKRLDLNTDARDLAALDNRVEAKVLVDSCGCYMTCPEETSYQTLYSAIYNLAQRTRNLYLRMDKLPTFYEGDDEESEFLLASIHDVGGRKVDQCETFSIEWHSVINSVTVYKDCRRMVFFMAMLQGAKFIRVTCKLTVADFDTLHVFVQTFTEALEQARDHFSDQVPNFCFLPEVFVEIPEEAQEAQQNRLIRLVEGLIPDLIASYELQVAMNLGHTLRLFGIVRMFKEMAFPRKYETPLASRREEEDAMSTMMGMDLEASLRDEKWHSWRERLEFLATRLSPGFAEQFVPSGNVKSEVLSMLTYVIVGDFK